MKQHAAEIARYIINGLLATAVHFTVLTTNLHVFHLESAGVANFIAACCGIVVSFLGSRYFVFQGHSGSIGGQAAKFVPFYVALALMHGAVLGIWTDLMHLDYRLGFLLATGFQVSLSYIGNKFLVFRT